MSNSRMGGINLLLLVITLGAVLFGAWGFLHTTSPERVNQTARTGTDDNGQEAASPSDGSRDKPDTRRPIVRPDTTGSTKPENRPDTRPSNTEPLPENFTGPFPAGEPSDHGDARIEGKVLGADGKGIASVSVTARRSDLDLAPPPFQGDDLEAYRADISRFLEVSARERRTTNTDASGTFVFTGLDGRLAYNLHASSDAAGSGDAERVAAGDSPVIILSADSLLRGKVQNAEGQPVTAFTVRAWRQNREWEARTQTFNTADGRFSMNGKQGSMSCEVTAKGYSQTEAIEVSVGPNSPEVTITLGKAAVLAGTIKDQAGGPLAGASVYLGGNEQGRGRWNGGWNAGTRVVSDSMGRYRFDSLHPKTQSVTASFGESTSTQTVDCKEGENTLDFALDSGSRLIFKLTGPTGQAVDAEEVWFQGKGGNWSTPTRLPAKEPGRAEFAGIKAGEYTATITASGWPALRKTLTVTDGENKFEFQFADGATLTGTVSGAGGVTLKNLNVRLRKDDEDAYGGWGTGRYAQVNADGKYKLGPAEPGQWKLEVYSGNDWKLVHSTVVTLAVGENSQSLVVEAGGTLVVTVLDESGKPAARADVQVRGDQTYNGRADNEGKATINFVAAGTYQIYASSRGQSSKPLTYNVNNGENPISLRLQKANACRLTYIYPDSQASKLGMQVGDLVFEYNGEQITSWGGLGAAIRKTRATDDVTMTLERNGQTLTFNLKGGTVGVEGADGVR